MAWDTAHARSNVPCIKFHKRGGNFLCVDGVIPIPSHEKDRVVTKLKLMKREECLTMPLSCGCINKMAIFMLPPVPAAFLSSKQKWIHKFISRKKFLPISISFGLSNAGSKPDNPPSTAKPSPSCCKKKSPLSSSSSSSVTVVPCAKHPSSIAMVSSLASLLLFVHAFLGNPAPPRH